MPGPRHRGRIAALQILYEADAAGHDIEGIINRNKGEESLPHKSLEFATELVRGVTKNLGKIDQILQGYAPHWPVSQLAVIDRNVLRIAIFELLWLKSTPPKAVANEAVEMAKAFGTESSPRFINGVLGSLIAEREKG